MRRLINITQRNFAAGKRPSWADYRKSSARYGQASDDNSGARAEYEKEVKERVDRKLNWNIKNRWEQRAMTDLY